MFIITGGVVRGVGSPFSRLAGGPHVVVSIISASPSCWLAISVMVSTYGASPSCSSAIISSHSDSLGGSMGISSCPHVEVWSGSLCSSGGYSAQVSGGHGSTCSASLALTSRVGGISFSVAAVVTSGVSSCSFKLLCCSAESLSSKLVASVFFAYFALCCSLPISCSSWNVSS